jgi:hypothetical protein
MPPLVLRGDPDLTRELIDSIDRKWKFTAGVCSWGPEDKVTPEQEVKVMDKFESVAFAGMESEQFNILWVRHSHAGHHELHFVIPRMELTTGKAFNAFPPGWEKDFGTLRELENLHHGWTSPDDPERTRMFAPSQADIIEARLNRWGGNPTKQEKDRARDAINAYVMAKVEGGAIRDRGGVVAALREANLDINREGKDYITVKDSGSGEKIRLKGGVYGAGWTLEEFGRANAGEGGTGTQRDRETIRRRIGELEEELAGIVAKRAAYNGGRYGGGNRGNERKAEPPLQNPEHSLRTGLDADRDNHICGSGRLDGGRLDADDGRDILAGRLPPGIGATTGGLPGAEGNPGKPEKRNMEPGVDGNGERTFHHSSAGSEPIGKTLDYGEPEGHQIGVNSHERERTGNNSIEATGTAGIRSGGSPAGTGQADRDNGGTSERLRAALDALDRVVSALGEVYRKLEQYIGRRKRKVERKDEWKTLGMER